MNKTNLEDRRIFPNWSAQLKLPHLIVILLEI
jgi:hypothetical protein